MNIVRTLAVVGLVGFSATAFAQQAAPRAVSPGKAACANLTGADRDRCMGTLPRNYTYSAHGTASNQRLKSLGALSYSSTAKSSGRNEFADSETGSRVIANTTVGGAS